MPTLHRAVAFFLIAVAPCAAQEPAPVSVPVVEVVDLGADGRASEALALSAAGHVAGWSESATGDTVAFAWDPVAGVRTIELSGTPYAVDVNDRGEVAIAVGDEAAARAFRWSPAGGLAEVGPIVPGTRVWIDAAGRVLGTRPNGPESARAFGWSAGRGAIDLPPDPSDLTAVYAAAPSGLAIGGAWSDDSVRAVTWDSAGGLISLRIPDEAAVLVAVNGGGTAAGTASGGSGWRAFRWPIEGPMEFLDLPEASTHGHTIDAAGRVAGVLYPDEGERRLYLWEPDGTVREIESPDVGGFDDLDIVLADDGTAAATVEPFSGPSIALWWSAETGSVPLEGLSGPGGVIRAIAAGGVGAGASLDAAERPRAVLWRIRPASAKP